MFKHLGNLTVNSFESFKSAEALFEKANKVKPPTLLGKSVLISNCYISKGYERKCAYEEQVHSMACVHYIQLRRPQKKLRARDGTSLSNALAVKLQALRLEVQELRKEVRDIKSRSCPMYQQQQVTVYTSLWFNI